MSEKNFDIIYEHTINIVRADLIYNNIVSNNNIMFYRELVDKYQTRTVDLLAAKEDVLIVFVVQTAMPETTSHVAEREHERKINDLIEQLRI
jgi:hypothetical protein